MNVEIITEPESSFDNYAQVESAFDVESVFNVSQTADGSFLFDEQKLDRPYTKDYDAIDGEHPATWPKRFDVSSWAVVSAHVDGRRVGGAVIAIDTKGLDMLEGRSDLAVLWDIRVAPHMRGNGIGSRLFQAAEDWARTRGYRRLTVETQNINVAACRLYARNGCALLAVNRGAYPRFPDEIQMLWYKDLTG